MASVAVPRPFFDDFGLVALRAKRVARVAVAVGSASLVVAYAAPLALALTTAGPARVHSLDALTLPNLQFPRLATHLPAQTHRAHAVPTQFFTTHRQAGATAAPTAAAPRVGAIAFRRNWVAPPPVTTSSYGPALAAPPATHDDRSDRERNARHFERGQ